MKYAEYDAWQQIYSHVIYVIRLYQYIRAAVALRICVLLRNQKRETGETH